MAQVALGKGRGFQNLLSGYVLPDEDATVLLPHRDGTIDASLMMCSQFGGEGVLIFV